MIALLRRPLALLSRPAALLRKPLAYLGLALIAVTVAVEPFLVKARGGRVAAWAHWWCSPSVAAHSSSGARGGGVAAVLLTPMRVLAVHWPHFLPLLVGLATMVYLRRANARYHGSGTKFRAPV